MQLRPFLIFSILLSATVSAQTPPCASLNDANTVVSTAIYAMGAAPNVYGWQYSPAQTVVVRAAQIYTGNNYFTQSMGLEVWSDDATTNLPKARLGGGYWKITQTTLKAWQGCNLDQTVVMTQGNKYWVVFIDPAWSTVPIEAGGTTMPYARFLSGTWSALNPSALKFRLFCSLLDQQYVQVKGNPCQGLAGIGSSFVNQAPNVGNNAFMIEGTGFQSGVAVLLLLGANPTWPTVPLPGANPACGLSTDIIVTVSGSVGAGANVRDPVAVAGQVVFPLPIPANPALVNGVVQSQFIAADPGSTWALPIVASNALVITLQ